MKKIIEWLISVFLPEYHLHLNPKHKVSDFEAPMPDFTMDGECPAPSECGSIGSN